MKYIASFKDSKGRQRIGFYVQAKNSADISCVCCLIPSPAWGHGRIPSVVEAARLCR